MPLVKRKTRKQQKSRINKRTTKSRGKSRRMRRGGATPKQCNPNCVRSKNEICSDSGQIGSYRCVKPTGEKGKKNLETYWETFKTTPEYNK